MRRCTNCLIPDLRPEQKFDDNGICDACLNFKNKDKTDWKKRKLKFDQLLNSLKIKNSKWDCIVPSSGGKDSTYQAIFLRDYGLKVLLVTASTCDLSILGRKNIENLKRLGFDTIEVSPNQVIRKKINKICLDLLGDLSWPEHVSIFTQPIHIACAFNIPLICWGENPQFEYGGPLRKKGYELDREWLEEFGGLLGFRVDDLRNHLHLDEKDLTFYTYPEDKLLKKKNINGIFLGFFFRWDNLENYLLAKKNGFIDYGKPIEGGYFSFEKLDNYQHGIHDYFKYLKYGFGRATDQLSFSIRKGKIERSQAAKLLVKHEGKFPTSYLGKQLEDILNDIDLNIKDFTDICDRFTNKKIFKCFQDGSLVKDENGNLKLNEDWNN